jgi:hypothetical protein
MNTYESVQQISELFKYGRFPLEHDIMINNVPYRLKAGVMHPIPEMIEKNYKGFVIYAVSPKGKENMNLETANEWVVLIWAIAPDLSIRPVRASTTTAARARSDMETATKALAEAENIIPDNVEVRFIQFNRPVKGKADTGANMSSLHAERWKVIPDKGHVRFACSLLSDNEITMGLHDQVHVRTSEGEEYRPVVSFDVSINGVDIRNALFNLNDRSKMQDMLLVGQNILEKGKFLIDPTIQKDYVPMQSEEVDWDEMQERFKDISLSEDDSDEYLNEQIKNMYTHMVNSNGSLDDFKEWYYKSFHRNFLQYIKNIKTD